MQEETQINQNQEENQTVLQNQQEMYVKNNGEKNNKLKKILFIVLGALIIGGIGYAGYDIIFNKQVTIDNINEIKQVEESKNLESQNLIDVSVEVDKSRCEELLEKMRKKTRDMKRISDIRQIQTGLGLYYDDANKYPENLGTSIKYNDTTYMVVVPTDPDPNNFQYTYQSLDNGQNYSLEFSLEVGANVYKSGNNITNPNEMREIMSDPFNVPGDDINELEKMKGEFAIDSDDDNLSDCGEEIIGSNPNNPDTDGDGYLDGDEVKNGYDPTMSGDARLEDRSNISTINLLTVIMYAVN